MGPPWSWCAALVSLAAACAGAGATPSTESEAAAPPDAPVVAAQPGAWFDAQGNLTVVGAGRRLRLRLSAPVVACEPAFTKTNSTDVASRASLPFHVLSEACRGDHPSILLAGESETASPKELELTYQEVARCAAELGATSGWIPAVVASSDPCPGALGVGWRLPEVVELDGLTIDDRKAVAGALYEADARAGFGSLLLYARKATGELTLVTLSPNASEQPPALNDTQRARPFFGAALRCVPQARTALDDERTRAPSLPHAAECLKALREAQSALQGPPSAPVVELQKLKAWVASVERSAALVENDTALSELSQLLATPALDRLARDAREERALTEHYAELAERLDDTNVSPGERQRRQAEFDNLRKRLGGRIVRGAVSSGSDRTQLSALLTHLVRLLEAAPTSEKPGKKSNKRAQAEQQRLLARLRALQNEEASVP